MKAPRKRAYGRGMVYRKRDAQGRAYGCWIAKYYVGTKPRYESTGTTDHTAAVAFLNDRMGAVSAGRAPAAGLHRVTIGDLCDDLLVAQEVENAPSLRTTRGHVTYHLQPAFGTLRAADLTTKHLQQFVTAKRKQDNGKNQGRPYSEASIARFLDTLHRALTLGRDATPPKVATIPAFPIIDESANVRKGFASVAVLDAILGDLRTRDADLADAVDWASWTGNRKGLVERLGWDSWDAETGTLYLPPPGRKKRTPQAIPLTPGHPLRAIIDRRWQRRKEHAKATGQLPALIFWRIHKGAPRPGLRPGDAVPVYEYRKAWATACRNAGAPTLTPHDLRRTAVRNAWRATRDRRQAMLLAGIATESIFVRYNIDQGDELVGTLDAIQAYRAAQPTGGDLPTVPTLPRAAKAGRRRRA